MYKEYNADEYNADITGNKEQLYSRWSSCARFPTDEFI